MAWQQAMARPLAPAGVPSHPDRVPRSRPCCSTVNSAPTPCFGGYPGEELYAGYCLRQQGKVKDERPCNQGRPESPKQRAAADRTRPEARHDADQDDKCQCRQTEQAGDVRARYDEQDAVADKPCRRERHQEGGRGGPIRPTACRSACQPEPDDHPDAEAGENRVRDRTRAKGQPRRRPCFKSQVTTDPSSPAVTSVDSSEENLTASTFPQRPSSRVVLARVPVSQTPTPSGPQPQL